jgi:hypothetical protein
MNLPQEIFLNMPDDIINAKYPRSLRLRAYDLWVKQTNDEFNKIRLKNWLSLPSVKISLKKIIKEIKEKETQLWQLKKELEELEERYHKIMNNPYEH